jgi:hypothetical protein
LADDITDGGTSSRKMWMAYAALVLITGGYVITAWKPELKDLYTNYTVAVLGAASIYSGTNAAVKYLHLKHGPKPKLVKKSVPVKMELEQVPTPSHGAKG